MACLLKAFHTGPGAHPTPCFEKLYISLLFKSDWVRVLCNIPISEPTLGSSVVAFSGARLLHWNAFQELFLANSSGFHLESFSSVKLATANGLGGEDPQRCWYLWRPHPAGKAGNVQPHHLRADTASTLPYQGGRHLPHLPGQVFVIAFHHLFWNPQALGLAQSWTSKSLWPRNSSGSHTFFWDMATF